MGLLDSFYGVTNGPPDPENVDPMQSGLTEAERKRLMVTNLLFGLGAGIGSAKRGYEIGGLSQGGMMGVNMGRQAIDDATKNRTMQIAQAANTFKLQRDMQNQQMMYSALTGGSTPQGTAEVAPGDPQQVNAPNHSPDRMSNGVSRDRLVNLNLANVAGGGHDMSPAIKLKYPDIIPLRAGAGAYDPATNSVMPNPVAPPGYYYDAQQNSFVKVSNGAQAEAASAAIPKAVGMAFEPPNPQKNDRGETFIPPGNRLSQQFGDGPLPYNAPTPFVTGAPQPQGQPQAPQGVRTDIGPTAHSELGKRGDTFAEQAAAIDASAASAQQTNARNKEMRGLVDQFTPGAASPFRRNVAGWLDAAGAPKEWVTKAAGGDLGAMQALQKQVVNAAFEATKQLTNRPAAAEVIMAATKGSPNEVMTKPAITAILDYNDGVTRWLTEKQQAKEAWIAPESGHAGSLAGFEATWNKTHPLDSYVPSVEQLQGVFKGAQPSGAMSKNVTALYKAREAIKAGADPAMVRQRLQQSGFSADGL